MSNSEKNGAVEKLYKLDKTINYGAIAGGAGAAALNLITVGAGAVIVLGSVAGLKVSEKLKNTYDRVKGKKTLGSEATKRVVGRARTA